MKARSEVVRKDEAVANEQAEESRALKEEVSGHVSCCSRAKSSPKTNTCLILAYRYF